MVIKDPTKEEKKALLNNKINLWDELISKIESLYDVDQMWNKGFGDWIYEYKFRRGGKTLCTLYMKKDVANILFTLGKNEQIKYDSIRSTFSLQMNEIYDNTKSFHDGKWVWIPIDIDWNDIYNLLLIKRKPNKKS